MLPTVWDPLEAEYYKLVEDLLSGLRYGATVTSVTTFIASEGESKG